MSSSKWVFTKINCIKTCIGWCKVGRLGAIKEWRVFRHTTNNFFFEYSKICLKWRKTQLFLSSSLISRPSCIKINTRFNKLSLYSLEAMMKGLCLLLLALPSCLGLQYQDSTNILSRKGRVLWSDTICHIWKN